MNRPSWEEYFMDIARLVARRSTCLRRQVGALVVKEKNILATGYNGTPSGITHCSEVGCLRQKLGFPPASGTNSAAACMPSRMPLSRRPNTG
jgi:dCMP deaminase